MTRALLVLALLLAAAAPARAANAKVAISNFQWSNRDVRVDLGEHVTWFWTGPDTQHSVTGDAGTPAAGWDSDPNTDSPYHPEGFTYRVVFNSPGVYQFHCKLHPGVNGTVTVSPEPGDPSAEPAPDPPLHPIDVSPPKVTIDALTRRVARGKPVALRYDIDQVSRVTVALIRNHRIARQRIVAGHIGYDRVALPTRGMRRGRYQLAILAVGSHGTENVPVRRSILVT
ncbi:MAG: biphenyl 2,3-dioxygenase [Solirubrobacteraceae bacterium]|nr:biphenyl 2,3-dioxygenase [Solirubrobacteraceae bacterium]